MVALLLHEDTLGFSKDKIAIQAFTREKVQKIKHTSFNSACYS